MLQTEQACACAHRLARVGVAQQRPGVAGHRRQPVRRRRHDSRTAPVRLDPKTPKAEGRCPATRCSISCELAYYGCWSPEPVTLNVLITVAGARWRVEEAFQVGKGLAGLDEYQARLFQRHEPASPAWAHPGEIGTRARNSPINVSDVQHPGSSANAAKLSFRGWRQGGRELAFRQFRGNENETSDIPVRSAKICTGSQGSRRCLSLPLSR